MKVSVRALAVNSSTQPKNGTCRRRCVLDDAALVEEIQSEISELPCYGYRRVWSLAAESGVDQRQAGLSRDARSSVTTRATDRTTGRGAPPRF